MLEDFRVCVCVFGTPPNREATNFIRISQTAGCTAKFTSSINSADAAGTSVKLLEQFYVSWMLLILSNIDAQAYRGRETITNERTNPRYGFLTRIQTTTARIKGQQARMIAAHEI